MFSNMLRWSPNTRRNATPKLNATDYFFTTRKTNKHKNSKLTRAGASLSELKESNGGERSHFKKKN